MALLRMILGGFLKKNSQVGLQGVKNGACRRELFCSPQFNQKWGKCSSKHDIPFYCLAFPASTYDWEKSNFPGRNEKSARLIRQPGFQCFFPPWTGLGNGTEEEKQEEHCDKPDFAVLGKVAEGRKSRKDAFLENKCTEKPTSIQERQIRAMFFQDCQSEPKSDSKAAKNECEKKGNEKNTEKPDDVSDSHGLWKIMFTGGSSENGHGTESLRKGMRKILRGLERGDEPKEAENSIPNPTQPEGARKSENTIQKHETVDSSKSGIHDEVVNNRGGKFGNNKRGETENDGSVLSSLPKRMKIRVVEDAAPQRKKTEVHSNKESKKQKEVEVECYKKEEEEEDSEEELLVLAKKAPILAKKPFDFFGLWSWNKEDEEPSLRCFPDSNNKTARKEQGETSSEDDVSHLKKLWKGESEKDSAAIAQRKKLLAADSVCRGPSMEDFGGVSDPPDMRSRSRDDEISAEDSQKGKRGAVKRRKSSSVVENIEASLMCESEATKLRQDLLRRMQLENEVKVVKEKINNLQEALRKIDEEKSEAFKLVAGTQGLLMKAIGLQKKWEEVAKEFDLRLASNVSSLAAARSKVEEAFENILTAEAFDRALQLYLAKTAALEQASNAMEDQLEGAIKEIEVHERTLRDAVDRIRKDPKTLEPYEKNVKESIAVVEDFAKICRSRLGGENVRGQKKNLALADEAEETVQEVLMEARQRHHRLEAEYQRTKKEVDALRDEAEKAYQKLGDAVLETGMLSYKKERLEETATEKTKEVEKIHKSLVRAEKRLDHLRKEFVELCAQSETQLPKQASEKISKFFEIHPK